MVKWARRVAPLYDICVCLAAVLLLIPTGCAFAESDSGVGLHEVDGVGVAYIAGDGDRTIYLRSGHPVAYLHSEDDRSVHVYGFNGRHIGWLWGGAIWDNEGDRVCVTTDIAGAALFEPVKSFQRSTPFKKVRELPPVRPIFSGSQSSQSCQAALASGAR